MNESLNSRWNIILRDNLNLFLGLIVISTIGLNSCCTEIYCNGADDIGDIEFLNFTQAELDSTFLVFYKKGSDFKIVEDSLIIEIFPVAPSKIFLGHSNRKLSVDYDYRLYCKLIKKEYKISEFKTSKEECNECFPRRDYYSKIKGYNINGKYKEFSVLQVDQLND
ncbi:MAG TPA: hypothetical protein VMV47_15150 [Bacteroidales bacterium]|nr:hypothetical protein [Bacteroidales bacterium]